MLTFLSMAYAHDGQDHSEEEIKSYSPMNPFGYFSDGEPIYGVLIIAFWLLIIKGIYELTLLILGRYFHMEQSNTKKGGKK